MSLSFIKQNGKIVAIVPFEGEALGSERSATDIIGDCFGQGVEMVAIPLERFAPEALDLKTKQLGLFVQKFVNYGLSLTIIGDVSQHEQASKPFADFVREANEGRHLNFVSSVEEI